MAFTAWSPVFLVCLFVCLLACFFLDYASVCRVAADAFVFVVIMLVVFLSDVRIVVVVVLQNIRPKLPLTLDEYGSLDLTAVTILENEPAPVSFVLVFRFVLVFVFVLFALSLLFCFFVCFCALF